MIPYLVTVRHRRPDGPGTRIEVEEGQTALLVSVR